MEPVAIPNLDIGKVYDSRYENSDFHIEKLDNLALFFGRNMPTHYHDRYYQIHVILEGTTHVVLDQGHYSLSGPTLFFTPPTVPHSFVTDDHAHGFVITASQPLVWRLLDIEIGRSDAAATAMQPFCARLDNPSKVVSLFEQLLLEQQSQQLLGDVASHALLQLVLIEVMRHANTQPVSTPFRSADVTLFNQFNQMIEQHYKQHLTLPEYAEQLGVTTARLNDICRKISGLSSKRLVAERLMQEARRLLLLTPIPVSQVAYELGYQDPAYFARFFKKQIGQTASDFRLAPKRESG
ncbi:4-hydroxyphenylacetate catabolism regulatory protein HpaA [Vibrio sinaloensis]|uniref:4-hydroxyphenylacetate catabolism regulatory protein HpaA n=1 Tax=Photobacterium sp. (strain ATCC 43367) TaxID=379097 RepID=UPI0020519AC4|nr:4-hydroxyphenylacetate catabolism regulatory protein HpaA [Vibrio sinaloensis]UPQ90282.1 4-hydroxyphenylacetate catabolism regulatory protein HpaA [Vibrio sinaloensis]